MKVLCIDKGGPDIPGEIPQELTEGQPYTVKYSIRYYSELHKEYLVFYKLAEIGDYHDSALFIPLSEISETEFLRNYNKQTA